MATRYSIIRTHGPKPEWRLLNPKGEYVRDMTGQVWKTFSIVDATMACDDLNKCPALSTRRA